MPASVAFSPIKTIQFFTTGNLQGAYTATATITAVNTAKSVIIPFAPEDYHSSFDPQKSSLYPSFVSSTVVRVTRTGNSGAEVIYGRGMVVEYI